MKKLICRFFGCSYDYEEVTKKTGNKYPFDVLFYNFRKCKRCKNIQAKNYLKQKYENISDYDDYNRDILLDIILLLKK